MRKRRKSLTPKARGTILSLAIGCTLGTLAGIGHINSVASWQEQRQAWVQEQIARDREIEAAKMTEQETDYIFTAEQDTFSTTWVMDPDIPEDVQEAAHRWGKEYNISPEFLEAIAFRESSYDGTAENGNCLGLMQVSIHWHSDRMDRLGIPAADIFKVDQNMHIACDYLLELFETYTDPYTVLAVYHGESDALDEDYKPSLYVTGILDMAAELTDKHEGGGAIDLEALKKPQL